MPKFFFNYTARQDVSVDDTGTEFPSLEAAYLDTCTASCAASTFAVAGFVGKTPHYLEFGSTKRFPGFSSLAARESLTAFASALATSSAAASGYRGCDCQSRGRKY